MPRGKRLNKEDRLRIIEAHKNGASTAALAREYGVWFAGGTVLAKTDQGFANRGLVVNPGGELVDHYDKVHLIRLMDEDKYFVPGRRACLFDVKGGGESVKAGCATCYDIRFCEWLRSYALAGAKVLFIGAEWPTSRIDHWEALLRARAIENQMYVVACNRCGVTEGSPFGGRSMILGPKGEVLFQAGAGEEAGFVILDTAEVDKTRKFLTVFDDRVPELYQNCAKA